MISPFPSLLVAVLLAAVSPVLLPAASGLEYERDIMPIFEEKCFDCHSEEAGRVKGGLQLDDGEKFLRRFAKNNVIIPGNWDASYLFVTITRPHESKEAMPPTGKGDPLTPEEIIKVAQWIHEGAKVGREKGDQGPDDYRPEDFLKFRDGVMVTDSYDTDPAAPAKGGAQAGDGGPDMPAAVAQKWTNREGREITATFRGLDGEHVILILEDGRAVPYPLKQLSAQSRAEALRLGGGSKDGAK